ncbi:MAG: chorismate-binding protein, partial [Propionibacteriaceae bacterium]
MTEPRPDTPHRPQIRPTLDDFRAVAPDQRVIPVWRRLMGDCETAVSLYAALATDPTDGRGRPGTFLLESAETNGLYARYSFIGVRAAATLTEVDGQAHWTGHVPVGLPTGGNPLEVVKQTLELLHTPRTSPAHPDDLPSLTSGLVGHISYDAVRRVERLPDDNVDDLQVPEVCMLLASDLAVLDHHTGEVWLIANAINFDATHLRVDAAYHDAVSRVEEMTQQLLGTRPQLLRAIAVDPAEPAVSRQRTPQEFGAAVDAAVEEIKAGEAFQIVVSQRFELPTSADVLDIYRVLRLTNPSPYMYLLRLDGYDIVGCSPEALVTVKDGHAVTHPIAGSKPRGDDPAGDAAYEHELRNDPKERAEHVMLVDLGRNDLGRVCRPGTVAVVEFMAVRKYSHIMHLESTVVGEVADGHSPVDVVMACCPACTLSGTPKVRAMEIIDRREASRRGLYGGVIGYFDFTGA